MGCERMNIDIVKTEKRYCALFIDEENIRIWLNNKRGMSLTKTILDYLDIEKLRQYFTQKGWILTIARCYIDPKFSGFSRIYEGLYKYGIQIVPIRIFKHTAGSSKSLLDPTLIVDCLSAAYEQQHIEVFIIVSGDKDYFPLALKLKEMGREVVFIGPPDYTAEIIKDEKTFPYIDITRFISSFLR